MSKLTVDQKKVKGLFQDTKYPFLIPDYQRPYAWGDDECLQLWNDLFGFAFPNDSCDQFNESDEYFLGPIVTFKNEDNKMEIIDGQQRLTTLMLLLRAFYSSLGSMKDENSKAMKTDIEKCLWRADMFGKYKKDDLKIDSEVATDNDKEEFMSILKDGNAIGKKSQYARNFRFFETQIKKFKDEYASYFAMFPAIILNKCVLLPIEAESQDTALRIFSTLNDRGKPLADADIFKAQFYKHYKELGQKDVFIERWKEIDLIANAVLHPIVGTPLDELFARYMYYERAMQKNTKSTTEALRKFYEKDKYAIFKRDDTLDNITELAKFWESVSKQDDERFSDRVLRRLFVLAYAPNSMWAYMVSVYFMHYRDAEGKLEDEKFYNFLNKLTAFVWAYALTNPGVNSLRTPLYTEMSNIVNDKPVTFSGSLFDENRFRSIFDNFLFTNGRLVTKAYMTWWAFSNPEQQLLPIDAQFDLEHIYPRARQDKEKSLSKASNIDLLGNKSLLERRINIRASDYRFEDKKKYYRGYTSEKGVKEGTKISDLLAIADSYNDFTEADIKARQAQILDKFIEYLRTNELLQETNTITE